MGVREAFTLWLEPARQHAVPDVPTQPKARDLYGWDRSGPYWWSAGFFRASTIFQWLHETRNRPDVLPAAGSQQLVALFHPCFTHVFSLFSLASIPVFRSYL